MNFEVNSKYEGERPGDVIFDSEKCRSILERGRHYEPNLGEIIIDTGDLEIENINNPYEETIANGVIDHHRIDNLFKNRDNFQKCSTQIVVDYKKEILETIKEKDVVVTFSHSDGDLDSVASSYLVQSLIQMGSLPMGAREIASHVNKVDYGMYREENKEKYLQSLVAIFSAVKKGIAEKGRKNKIENDNELNEVMFQIFNIIKDDFDCEKGIEDFILARLPRDTQELIKNGRNIIKKELDDFEEDFEKAEKSKILVKTIKNGSFIEVPLVVSLEPRISSLDFINFSYLKTSPEAVIAVYAGPKRKEGYMYNVSIRPESAEIIDLSDICMSFNRAEKEKRDELPSNSEILKDLENQPDRLNMSGPEQILTKDPSVIVGKGSLVSAPRYSLLSKDDFYRNIKFNQSFNE